MILKSIEAEIKQQFVALRLEVDEEKQYQIEVEFFHFLPTNNIRIDYY